MSSLGAVSYLAGGAAFLLLTALLVTSWRGRLQGGLLVVASGLNALWCLLLAYDAVAVPRLPLDWLFAAEVVRTAAWLLFLVRLLGVGGIGLVPARFRWAVHGLWLLGAIYALAVVAIPGPQFVPEALGQGFFLMPFALVLVGLILLEQLYRNTRPERRWAVKFLCLGLGGLFTYDLYLHAHGLLLRQLDADLWMARGSVNLLVVPLLGVAVRRNPQWSLDLFVSRHVVFYTGSLVAVGIYLLAMAGGGYWIREVGGTWGSVAQVIFFFGAALLLALMLFSGQLRARLKVLLSKHFYSYKYDYRDEWLRLIRSLSAPDAHEPLEDRSVIAVAEIVESPRGGLWLRRDDQFVPSAGDLAGPDSPVEPASSPLVELLEKEGWIVDVRAERGGGDPAGPGVQLPGWLLEMTDAWLVVPLLQGDEMHGFMVLAEPRAPQKLSWEVLDLLKTVGRQVAGYLALKDAASRLTQAQQFEAYNRLTAFVMHDLKNLVAQQSLVVKNAARFKDNPEFVNDTIETVKNSVRRMTRLLEQLQQGDAVQSTQWTSLPEVCRAVVARCAQREPSPQLEIEDASLAVRVGSERLAMVLGHAVRNAQEATPADGSVRICLRRDEQMAVVEVVDTGPGMTPRFVRERLFRPFDTTKGSQGMGIGAYQTREFARMAGGDVTVESDVGVGTRFTILLPIATQDENFSLEAQVGQ